MIKKRDLADAIASMDCDMSSQFIKIKELEKTVSILKIKVFEYETQIKYNTLIIDGLTKKIMQMENKFCTCKPDAKLAKKKKTEKKLEKAIKEVVPKRKLGRPKKK